MDDNDSVLVVMVC